MASIRECVHFTITDGFFVLVEDEAFPSDVEAYMREFDTNGHSEPRDWVKRNNVWYVYRQYMRSELNFPGIVGYQHLDKIYSTLAEQAAKREIFYDGV